MSGLPGHNFNDRLKSQKEAKLAMLKRAQEKQLDPELKAKKMAERAERNKRREEREAEKARLRAEEAKRLELEREEEERKARLAAEARVKAEDELRKAQKARRDARRVRPADSQSVWRLKRRYIKPYKSWPFRRLFLCQIL
jgi:hypothetical protein